MRSLNRALLLDQLKTNSPQSRADLAKATRLAKPTVSAIIDELLRDGLVREVGRGISNVAGGRPPTLLEFDASSSSLVAVHIGVRRTTVILTDARGHELARHEQATRRRPSAVFGAVVAAIDRLTVAVGADQARIAAVGVCVPGLVDQASGVCLLAPNLGWHDVPVAELLASQLADPAPPVVVQNTAQACAMAEVAEGAARGSRDVVLLYAGSGVGVGLVCDGELYRGSAGLAGEIGHVPFGTSTAPCSCGRIGCLETVVSGPALQALAASAGLGPLWIDEIIAAAHGGSAVAAELLVTAGRQLGRAAAWLVNLLNPELLVVGGAMADAGPILLDALEDEVRARSLPQAERGLAVRPWAVGQDAKLRGATLVALQRTDDSLRLR